MYRQSTVSSARPTIPEKGSVFAACQPPAERCFSKAILGSDGDDVVLGPGGVGLDPAVSLFCPAPYPDASLCHPSLCHRLYPPAFPGSWDVVSGVFGAQVGSLFACRL